MLTMGSFLLSSYLLYLFYYGRGAFSTKIISAICLSIVALFSFNYFQSKADSTFSLISERASEDTREYVFFNYFSDMSNDLWLGRGMRGEYYCPIPNLSTGEYLEYRDVIECGYLQVILKGGIINLLIMLLIFIPAVYRGLVYSKNGFSKACAIVILLWLIDMFPFGLPSLSIRYFLVWMAVGVCYSNSVIMKREEDVKKMLS